MGIDLNSSSINRKDSSDSDSSDLGYSHMNETKNSTRSKPLSKTYSKSYKEIDAASFGFSSKKKGRTKVESCVQTSNASEEVKFYSAKENMGISDRVLEKQDNIMGQAIKIKNQQNLICNKQGIIDEKIAKLELKIQNAKGSKLKLEEKRQNLRIKNIKYEEIKLRLERKQLKLDLKSARIDVKIDKKLNVF